MARREALDFTLVFEIAEQRQSHRFGTKQAVR
jgi:hypothetical protein